MPRPTRSAPARRSSPPSWRRAREQLSGIVAERAGAEDALAAAERALVVAARADRRPARVAGDAGRPGRCAALPHDGRRRGDRAARGGRGRGAATGPRPRSRSSTRCRARSARSTRASSASTRGTRPRSARTRRLETELQALRDAEREAERDRTSWLARRDALALGLTRKDGAGALLAAGDRLPGLLGSVAALLTVEPGHEVALAAALGGLADAVAVAGADDALAALRLLKDDDAGRAGLLIGSVPAPASPPVSQPGRPRQPSRTCRPARAGRPTWWPRRRNCRRRSTGALTGVVARRGPRRGGRAGRRRAVAARGHHGR